MALAAWLAIASAALAQPQRIALSDTEQAWIAAHPVVRVGLSREFPPYYTFDETGRPQGFAVEMLDLWLQRTGLTFEFHRYGSFAEVLAALQSGAIDMTPFTSPTEDRREYASFPRPFFVSSIVVAARRDVPDVSDSGDFGGRKVAVETGSAIEALVRERYPYAQLQRYADAESALKALSSGQADLFIGYQHVIVYEVEKALLANVELRRNLGPSDAPIGPAVRRELPILHDILDQAIESIDQADRSRLAERWLPAASTRLPLPARTAQLNDAEKAWVRQHNRIRVGYDAYFAPFSQRGELGDFQGLGADVLRLAARKAGLEIEQEFGGSFADVYARGVDGRLDVIVGMARTPQRRADYDFVGPFINAPTALFMRGDERPLVTDIAQIGMRKLALLRDHFLIPELRARHPGIALVEFDRQDQVLAAVADGVADAGLGNIQVVNDLIERRYGNQLRITGTVRDGDSELFFAVPRRRPELTRVLRAGLEAINDSEMADLRVRWLLVKVTQGPSWRALLQIALPVAAVLAAYLFLLMRGNRRLRASRAREQEARRLAEESTAARSRFLAYLSHELRGGLSAIGAGVELMRNQPDPALRERLLGAIVESTDGLRRVLDTTLAYEQSLQAPLALHPEPIDLAQWWSTAVAPGELAARRKGLGYRAQWQVAAGSGARLDGVRLQQALQNLIGNAVKFTERGEVVVSGSLDAQTRELCLAVRDTGPGLSADDRERVFQPYAQGLEGRQLREGAGLGLAICRQIVEAMRGRVEVESEPGHGALFRIVVPRV